MDETKQLPAQLNKVVNKEGSFGRKPSLGAKCRVRFKVNGGLRDEIKSEYLLTDAAEIIIGDGDWFVDKWIEACLETMHLEEESTFILKVSEDEEVNVEISLDGFKQKGYVYEWSNKDKLEAAKLYKASGIILFKQDRTEHAFFKFSKAQKMLLLIDDDLEQGEWEEKNELMVSLYNNLANCQFQFKNYDSVIELCSKSLLVKPNVKAYFWRALGYIELKDYDRAEYDILELLKIEPRNRIAIEKYKLIRKLNKESRENYETFVKNMFR